MLGANFEESLEKPSGTVFGSVFVIFQRQCRIVPVVCGMAFDYSTCQMLDSEHITARWSLRHPSSTDPYLRIRGDIQGKSPLCYHISWGYEPPGFLFYFGIYCDSGNRICSFIWQGYLFKLHESFQENFCHDLVANEVIVKRYSTTKSHTRRALFSSVKR